MFIFPTTLLAPLFQYPTNRQSRFTTQVLAFVGGTEQRYPLANAALRRWEVQPTILKDAVMDELIAFFELVGGTARSFSFTDPWTGTFYPFCYFEADRLEHRLTGEGRNSVSFAILEGRN